MMEEPIIKIDNVYQYIRRASDKGRMLFLNERLVPPFNNLLFLWRDTERLIKAQVTTCEYPDMSKYPQTNQEVIGEEYVIDYEARWSVEYKFSAYDEYGFVHILDAVSFFDSDGFGTAGWLNKPSSEYDSILLDWFRSGISQDDMMEHREQLMAQFAWPVLASCAFMHCKNVHLIDEPLTRQRRRKLERKGGIRYKILDIEPFKKQVRRETQPGESQLQRALHICRGHFATYTEDKPLFGKLVGTYWKPMHVRGNRAQGQVVKDYNIVLE